MPLNVDIYGVYIPGFFGSDDRSVSSGENIALYWWAKFGFYSLVWHRALFDIALYVLVLGAFVFLDDKFIDEKSVRQSWPSHLHPSRCLCRRRRRQRVVGLLHA